MANTSGSATAGQIFTFKLDKDDLNDLKQTIGDSRKQSLADALAVFADRAKSVIGFAENKIAEFEKGYLNAQLAGTSSKDMRALEGVSQEFGVSAEAVRASVQALHRNARDDPQAAALLEKLYISASNGAGGQRDSIDLIQELGDALKNLTSQQASDAGNKLGMDPQLMEAMRSPGFGQQLSVMRDSLEDSKIEAAGERAHRIMKSVRDIGLSVDEMFAQALLTMADRLEPMLQSISAWFKENGAEAGKRLGEIGNLVLTVMSLFGPLISALTWLDGATGGLSSEIMLLVGGFLLLGGGGVVGALMSLFSSLGSIRGVVGALGPRLASMAGTIGSAVSRAWSTVSGAASSMFGSVMAQGRAVMTQLGGWAGSLWSSVGGLATRGVAAAANGMKAIGETAMQWGQSFLASAGSWLGRLVDGAKALGRGTVALAPRLAGGAGLLLYPSSLGDDQKLLREIESNQAKGLPGPGFTQVPGSVLPPALEGTQVAPWRDYQPGFVTGAAAGVAAGQQSGGPVSVNATTNVYVNGSIDPLATGQAVASQQDRVNADLTRNLQGNHK